MLVLSITSMKPPPFSPTLTFSPCLITLLNMALSGLKLWDCTFQIPLRPGCSQVPRIYDRTDLNLPGNRHVALPSILKRYFCSELTITQFAELLSARQAEDEKILDTAATTCRKMKRAKQTLARLPHSTASSTNTVAPLAPASMSNTPPPSPRIPDTGRSRTPPPDPTTHWHAPRPTTEWVILLSNTSALPSPPPRTVYARFPTGPMKVCGLSCVEISSAELSEEDTLVRWQERT